MGTIGLPDTIPNKYTGPEVNLVPIRFFPHEPVSINKKFPVGQFVILQKNPTTGNEGDLWYLSKFSGGNPIWLPLTGGGVGPTITLSDTANTLVYPTGLGNIQLEGSSGLTITSDPGSNKLVFALSGGGTAIDSFIVPSGTSPVVPDAMGQVTINAGTGITITGGLNQYTIGLTGGGVSIDSLGVQTTSGTGTNPVVPDGAGKIELTGALVAAGANPLRAVSTAANTVQYQVQTSQALSAPDATMVGMSNYSSIDFNVDSNGFVQLTGSSSAVGVKNIGFSYNAGTGTFTVHGQDGTALSSTNPGFVTLQDRSSPGNLMTIAVTANQNFIDDNGASQIIGNLFGLTTGIATTGVDIPFFLYAVPNDAETAIAFMISRFPNATMSPVAAKIGMPSTAVADSQGSFFSFDNVTAADYESNPTLSIGSFRMRMSAADDWTVQTLAARDGIGHYQEGLQFDFPRGQFGSAAGKVFKNNGGTAPNDADGGYTYYIDSENNRIFYQLAFPSIDTAGVGAVTAQMALVFNRVEGATSGGGFSFGASYSMLSTYTIPTSNTAEFVFVNETATGLLTNASIALTNTLSLNGTIGIEFS